MKKTLRQKYFFLLGLFTTLFFISCASTTSEIISLDVGSSTRDISGSGDLVKYYKNVVDLGPLKGQSFFSVMQEKIKPGSDAVVPKSAGEMDTVGVKIISTSETMDMLKVVGSKVSGGVIRASKGPATVYDEEKLRMVPSSRNSVSDSVAQSNLVKLTETVRGNGKVYNTYNFFGKSAQIYSSFFNIKYYGPNDKRNADIDNEVGSLATYWGLVSGSGVAVKINNNNYYYNVNYAAGKGRPGATSNEDERSGRSFSASNGSGADDVSDKDYLTSLEKYVKGENPSPLFKCLIDIIGNTDVSCFSGLSVLGQKVANDFIAVYTAEQLRNLMKLPSLTDMPWDDALLQVTLLSAFHSGQDKIKVFFNGNRLVERVNNQTFPVNGVKPVGVLRDASLIDYWQVANSGRSGINLTRSRYTQFEKLGIEITKYERANHPELIKALEKYFPVKDNAFSGLARFFINYSTAKNIKDSNAISAAFVSFLNQVKLDANDITKDLD